MTTSAARQGQNSKTRKALLGFALLIPAGLLGMAACASSGVLLRSDAQVVSRVNRVDPAPSGGTDRGGVGLFGPDRRNVSLQNRINLYRQFNVGWVRINSSVPISPSHGMTDPEETAAFRQSGARIFMTAASLPAMTQPTLNMAAYQAAVSELMSRYRPDVIAAENEVDNQGYKGSVGSYLNEVRVLCGAAHRTGAKCTDSGLTVKTIIAVYLRDRIHGGDPQSIAMGMALLNEWYGMRRGPGNTSGGWEDFAEREHIANADTMLRGLRSTGADFVNLHWYAKTTGGVSEQFQNAYLIPAIVTMLRAKTGLPVIGGEVGLEGAAGSDAASPPESIGNELRALKCSGVNPVILWNPGAGNFPANPRALSLFQANGRPLRSALALRAEAARWKIGGCPR